MKTQSPSKKDVKAIRREAVISIIGAAIYQMPKPLREFPNAWCARVTNIISSPFKSEGEAEIWAMEQWILDITNCEVDAKDSLIREARYRHKEWRE